MKTRRSQNVTNKEFYQKKATPGSGTKETATVQPICRMNENWKIKSLPFGIMDGRTK